MPYLRCYLLFSIAWLGSNKSRRMKQKIKDFCERQGLTESQFCGETEVSGMLDLISLTSIPDGFNPTVGGWLDLSSLTSIPDGFNPTVGGWLDLSSLTSIPDGFNPTVGGSLDLRSLTSIPDGFNPTVGGWLYLSSLTSIPDGFNPTVGGSLDLRSLTSIPDGFNPTVGGWLDLRSSGKYIGSDVSFLSWQDGKYIMVDGIFSEVISRKGNVIKAKKIKQDKEFYIVTDGERWAHGDTIKQAREDLIYKIGNVDKSEFEGIDKSKKMSFKKAIECYRVITGACSFGVRDFIKSNGLKKSKYSPLEIAEITKGAYGNAEFKSFFGI